MSRLEPTRDNLLAVRALGPRHNIDGRAIPPNNMNRIVASSMPSITGMNPHQKIAPPRTIPEDADLHTRGDKAPRARRDVDFMHHVRIAGTGRLHVESLAVGGKGDPGLGAEIGLGPNEWNVRRALDDDPLPPGLDVHEDHFCRGRPFTRRWAKRPDESGRSAIGRQGGRAHDPARKADGPTVGHCIGLIHAHGACGHQATFEVWCDAHPRPKRMWQVSAPVWRPMYRPWRGGAPPPAQ